MVATVVVVVVVVVLVVVVVAMDLRLWTASFGIGYGPDLSQITS